MLRKPKIYWIMVWRAFLKLSKRPLMRGRRDAFRIQCLSAIWASEDSSKLLNPCRIDARDRSKTQESSPSSLYGRDAFRKQNLRDM